jgi:hypothetical protein
VPPKRLLQAIQTSAEQVMALLENTLQGEAPLAQGGERLPLGLLFAAGVSSGAMNTKLLMRSSAVFMGMLGVAASFLPQEILAWSGATPQRWSAVIVQMTGAIYLGFAALNWAAQANLIGAIYSRPVALGNFIHFTVAAMALLRAAVAGEREPVLLVGVAAYTLFAVLFGWVMFRRPPGLGRARE